MRVNFFLPNLASPDLTFKIFMIQISLCLGLFFTFPVMMVPVYDILERTFTARKWFDNYARSETTKYYLFNVLRAVLVTITVVAAVTVPGFGLFISLIGSGCCSVLAFVLPTLFHIKTCKPSGLTLVTDLIVLGFGLVGGVLGTIDSLYSIVHRVTG